MKKYIIITHEVYNRLVKNSQNDQKKLDTVEFKSTHNMENKMNDLITSSLPSDKKKILYSEILSRYVSDFKDQNKQNNSAVVKHELNVEDILKNTLPRTLIKNGLSLLDFIKSKDSIRWNSQGEVTIDNDILHNSNILDLINYSIRNIKNIQTPIGYVKYLEWLKKINIPIILLNNKNLIDGIMNIAQSTTISAAANNYSHVRKKRWKKY